MHGSLARSLSRPHGTLSLKIKTICFNEKKLFVLVLHEEGRKQGNKREKLLELLHLKVEM